MKEQERRYRKARVAKENWDVREQASAGIFHARGHGEASPSLSSYDVGSVGLQPRSWCQVLQRALGVALEDCLFAVGPMTIYAVVADPKRALRDASSIRKAEVKDEVARLGASSRSVVLRGVSRKLFDAASAAQRMGGDRAALEVLGYEVPRDLGVYEWLTKRNAELGGPAPVRGKRIDKIIDELTTAKRNAAVG